MESWGIGEAKGESWGARLDGCWSRLEHARTRTGDNAKFRLELLLLFNTTVDRT